MDVAYKVLGIISFSGLVGALGGGLSGLGGYNGLPSVMSGLDESMSDIEVRKKYPFELEKAMHNVMFIQHHMQRQDEFNAVSIRHLTTTATLSWLNQRPWLSTPCFNPSTPSTPADFLLCSFYHHFISHLQLTASGAPVCIRTSGRININGWRGLPFYLPRYRRIRTGDSWQWYWTGCSSGYSRWRR